MYVYVCMSKILAAFRIVTTDKKLRPKMMAVIKREHIIYVNSRATWAKIFEMFKGNFHQNRCFSKT